MAQPLEKAAEISHVFKALRTSPLQLTELERFFLDTSDARGDKPRQQMARSLRNNIGVHQHLLLVGYRGCGKSTELRRLQSDLEADFLILNFSVYEELDPNELNYIELVIVTMERLFYQVKEHHLTLSPNYLQSIKSFLLTEEIQDIREGYMEASMEIGAETQLSIPFLHKFFAMFRASTKGSRSLKKVLTEKVEPHFSRLLNQCNDLVAEIRLQLETIHKSDLLIIIEDLDKIQLSQARSLFFNYSPQLSELKVNIIYTFPISLYYDIHFNTVKNSFTKVYELPMIKVHEKDGSRYEKGINKMREIIAARMDLELFEDAEILDELILKSGGCLRDLFTMISEAAEKTQDDERMRINREDDLFYAVQKLKRSYRNTIADSFDSTGEIIVKASEYYDVLDALNESRTKQPENSIATMHLRQNTTILGYNGEGWCDVHPVVKEILSERD